MPANLISRSSQVLSTELRYQKSIRFPRSSMPSVDLPNQSFQPRAPLVCSKSRYWARRSRTHPETPTLRLATSVCSSFYPVILGLLEYIFGLRRSRDRGCPCLASRCARSSLIVTCTSARRFHSRLVLPTRNPNLCSPTTSPLGTYHKVSTPAGRTSLVGGSPPSTDYLPSLAQWQRTLG